MKDKAKGSTIVIGERKEIPTDEIPSRYRYWEARLPDFLADWVNKEICEAMDEFWGEGNIDGRIGVKDGRFVLTVIGPLRPATWTPDSEDEYEVDVDILKLFEAFAKDDWDDEPDERAAALRRLADQIAMLATMAEQVDGKSMLRTSGNA